MKRSSRWRWILTKSLKVELFFQDLKIYELMYRKVKSENILAKQLAKLFRYSLFLLLAQYTKHYHTKMAIFLTYNPEVLTEENMQIKELFCFLKDIQWYFLPFWWCFSSQFVYKQCMKEHRELQWVLEQWAAAQSSSTRCRT